MNDNLDRVPEFKNGEIYIAHAKTFWSNGIKCDSCNYLMIPEDDGEVHLVFCGRVEVDNRPADIWFILKPIQCENCKKYMRTFTGYLK